ncbi:MAG: DUF6056 family protein [Lachnospiraceae bacterium]|nr:DUF6056 family protein [Lachnospiraceae bacterium]
MIYLLSFWGGNLVTTVSAIRDLYTGEAQIYYEEYLERLEILEDDTISDAVLEPFSYYPYVLFFEDIKEDPDHWANKAYATYYGKNSVRLAEE